jgi:CRP-like cAMP-binding protein
MSNRIQPIEPNLQSAFQHRRKAVQSSRSSDLDAPPLGAFLRRHGNLHFDEHESSLLEGSALLIHREATGTYIRHQGDRETRPWIVASGWACYARTLSSGGRQIFGFAIPGDTIGLADGPLARRGSEIVALTAIVLLDATGIRKALVESPGEYSGIRSVCDAEQDWHEARLLDQVVRLGQLSSIQRTAHLILELHHRMDRAGLAHNGQFQLPLTQFQIGETLGLSLVHVNRTIQALRSRGLLALNGGVAVIPNMDLLEHAAAA